MTKRMERIKALETQLGKYRKKIDDQQKLVSKLSGEVEQSRSALEEIQSLTDAILANAAIACGEPVEEDGKTIGYRLTIPAFSVQETLEKYKIGARKDENGAYTLGVMEKKE